MVVKPMWSEVLKRIDELKQIDGDCVGMGVETHRYQFGPKLSEDQIEKYEARLSVKLPAGLRSLYIECGNGGCGPDWGVRPIDELVAHRPNQKFPGLNYFRHRSEIEAEVSGMIGFMDRYYDHEACIVTNGIYEDCVIEYIPEADCVYLGAIGLPTLYHCWLDRKLESFNHLKREILKFPDIDTLLFNLGKNRDPVYFIPAIASLLRLDIDKSRDWHFTKTKRELRSDGTISRSLDTNIEELFNTGIKAFASDKKWQTMSITHQRFTGMKFLAIDVHYRGNEGYVAGMTFSDHHDDQQLKTYKCVVNGIENYVSGEFYRRELPCILALLNEHNLSPECIIIDGFVHLEQGKPGLGKYLFDALNGKTSVIGVAKNPRGAIDKIHEVYRGISTKPLFVTAEGIELELAKNIVKYLKGASRIPDYLQRVDSLSRGN